MTRDIVQIVGSFLLVMLAVTLILLRFTPLDISGGDITVLAPEVAAAEAVKPVAPAVLSSPRAILVLDVSGTMRRSDPELLEALAAEQFFQIYEALSREVLLPGDTALIALVFFGTRAQAVDWSQGGDAANFWLPVTRAALTVFRAALRNYLGSPDEDRRRGWDTDHLAAVRLADQLASGSSSPPVVVFMTDGEADPHPLFTPFVPDSAAVLAAAERGPEVLTIVQATRSARSVGLPFDDEAAWIDTRALGIADMRLDADDLRAYLGSVRSAVEELESRRMKVAGGVVGCPLWIPVFLDIRLTDSVDEARRDVLSNSGGCAVWQRDRGVRVVKQGAALSRAFTRSLVPWFGLSEQPWEAGTTLLRVPVGTQAVAVVLELEDDASQVSLNSGTRRVRLDGADRTWAGVLTEPAGDWRLDAGGVTVRTGLTYLRPRYTWTLAIPPLAVISDLRSGTPIEVRLYSFDDAGLDDPRGMYRRLPETLPADVGSIGGEGAATPTTAFALRKAPEEDFVTRGVGYVGVVPTGRLAVGEASVRVRLDALAGVGVPLTDRVLRGTMEAVPRVTISITDGEGRPVCLRMRAPRFTATVRGWLGGGA